MKESGPNSNQQEKTVNDVKPEMRCYLFRYHHRIIVVVVTITIAVVIVVTIIVMMMIIVLTQSLEPPSSRSINHNKQALHRGHHDDDNDKHDNDDNDDDDDNDNDEHDHDHHCHDNHDRSSHNSRPSQSIILFSERCPLINYKWFDLSGILIYLMGRGFILWNFYILNICAMTK